MTLSPPPNERIHPAAREMLFMPTPDRRLDVILGFDFLFLFIPDLSLI